MKHFPYLLVQADRVVPTCSCGQIEHRLYFGDRRTANAKQHIYRHMEAAVTAANGFDAEDGAEPEFHIKADDSNYKCPVCEKDLDLKKDDLGLLKEDDPSIVNCENNHDFSAYLKNGTIFLYLEGSDSHSPFSTTN